MTDRLTTDLTGSWMQRPPDLMELSAFCHQMSLVLRSGIHPMEGVLLISDEIGDPRLKASLRRMGKEIASGMTFHESLRNAGLFPKYLIEMALLGEQTGMLESTMENLSTYFEREDRLRRRIRSAVAYPAILAVLMSGLIVLLLTSVLPMFARVMSSLGAELPAATQMLMNAGTALASGGPAILCALVVLVTAGMAWNRTSDGRRFFDHVALVLPISGKIARKAAAARFSSGMSMVLRSGMTVELGMPLVQGVMDNRFVADRLESVAAAVRDGDDMTEALEKTGLFPRLFVRMLRVGQKSGDLDRMMAKVASVFDEEVERTLQTVTQLIEPVVVVLLSAVVGTVLLAVMLPLIRMMGSIG